MAPPRFVYKVHARNTGSILWHCAAHQSQKPEAVAGVAAVGVGAWHTLHTAMGRNKPCRQSEGWGSLWPGQYSKAIEK